MAPLAPFPIASRRTPAPHLPRSARCELPNRDGTLKCPAARIGRSHTVIAAVATVSTTALAKIRFRRPLRGCFIDRATEPGALDMIGDFFDRWPGKVVIGLAA